MLSRRDTIIRQNRPYHALRLWLTAFALLACSTLAQALGLGELRVQSMLGQALRASVPVLGREPDNVLQVCVKAKVLALDGTFLTALRVTVNTDPRSPALMLSSTQVLSEPAVTVLVEVICEANIARQYQILLDPPEPASADAAKAAEPAPADASKPAKPAMAAATAPIRAAASASAAGTRPESRLKVAARLSASATQPRNVLKVTGEQSAAQDIAGNTLPVQAGKQISPTSPTAPAAPDAPVKLLLARRLASDTSPISKVQVQAFSETVRQEQNSAVLIEVGRAEVRTLQKQIEQLEAELKQVRALARVATNAAASMAVAAPALQAAVTDLPAPEAATRQNRAQEWVIGLAALLLMCLLAIGWLLWRLLQLRSRQVSFSAALASGNAPPAVAASSILASIFARAKQSAAVKPSLHPSPVAAEAAQADATGASKAASSKVASTSGNQVGRNQASSKAAGTPPAKVPSPEPSGTRHEPAIRVASASVALPALDAPPELYKAEKVVQADEPLEFTFPDELQLQTEAPAESLHGLHRNSIDYATETEIPTVEEFTDVMYEAEFWISLGKLDKAIAVLEQYTAFENVSSPLPWLFLFDMYRKTDGHDQYCALQRQFQRMFNGKIPDWEDYDTEHQNMGLENMTGLMSRVEAFWMTDEIVPFLESLLVDDRDGTRQGFELGVYRDILFLTDIAKEVQKSNEYEKLSSVFKLAPLE